MKTINYATIGVIVRFLVGRTPEFLVVKYQNENEEIEIRFPGGSVTFSDVYKAIEWYLSTKITSINNSLIWVLDKITSCEKDYFEKIDLYEKRHDRNNFFNFQLSLIFDDILKCNLPEEDLDSIFEKMRIITLEREINQETDTEEFGHFRNVSRSIHGNHERCCYVSTDTIGPDEFVGSGDDDIKGSLWEPIEVVIERISPKHSNYFLSAVLNIVNNNLHPRAHELAFYCQATNN